ncbi:MAG: radical SAM family heme chaperone HemW, partial [Pseudomonadota bacterium]
MMDTMFKKPQKFPDDLEPIGVYIHIPFCKSRCNYCGFVSHNSDAELEDLYVGALNREIEHLDSSPVLLNSSFPNIVDTIYFGGGTPSVLEPRTIGRLIQSVCQVIIPASGLEITVEVNPGTYRKDQLAILRDTGVTRLSIGAQSLNDSELRRMNRSNSSYDFIKLYDAARGVGFDNISVDLLAGYPGQTIESMMKSVLGIIELEPEHISVYLLEIKSGSRLERKAIAGLVKFPDDDLAADMYESTCLQIEESGFQQYEISNFSKKGKESLHNIKYWSDKIFLGFGLAAHGMTGRARYSNVV